ncbi:MAG TPA: hypothetical protein VE685_25805 [Thermoanaerobaculia bacterium]|nr:hypothetical protein [Thermoanaerobaculia bacterium]
MAAEPEQASETKQESIQVRLQQAYLDHLHTLQNLSASLQKRQSEALARSCEQLRSELQGVSLADAYQRYQQALREAEGDQRSAAETAGRDLLSAIQEAQGHVQRSQESAGRQYAEALQQAWDEAQGQLRDQHLAYSRILHDIWARVNQGDPDPGTLVLLSQSLMAAALTAPLPAR